MKILLVEDEYRIASYIKKGLELKSFVVDIANDGQEGLDLALDEKYDVIILDWMLPGLPGIEILKEIRKEGNNTPVLILTAKDQVDDRVAGLNAGSDDYLPKPFAFVELIARVKALSRRKNSTINNILKSADLTLNTDTYEVRRADKVINLSKKEYALLEFLLRHQGKIFSKDQLTQQVWPYDSDVLANTAQVYIGYLRKKIDKAFPGKPEIIKTVRGFGYKIDK